MKTAEYAGTFLALIIGLVSFLVWAVSLIVELIEPSRVKKAYYWYLLTGWLAPLIALVGYVLLRGEFAWMRI